LDGVDNTEKRAISPADLNLIQTLAQEGKPINRQEVTLYHSAPHLDTVLTQQNVPPTSQLSDLSSGPVSAFHLQPFMLNSRPHDAAVVQSTGDRLDLLEQLVYNTGDVSEQARPLPHQLLQPIGSSLPASDYSVHYQAAPPTSTGPSLDAFRVLMSQTKSEQPPPPASLPLLVTGSRSANSSPV